MPAQSRAIDPLDLPPALVTLGYLKVVGTASAACAILLLFLHDRMRPAEDLVTKAPLDIPDGLLRVWPLFVWGVVSAALVGVVTIVRDVPRPQPPAVVLRRGIWISLNAGLFEEFLFRFVMFMNAVVGLLFVNLITFGLVRWVYRTVLIPVADWATLGVLHPQLHHAAWAVGAAVLSVNGAFRNRHGHLGLLGYVNSWFVGIVMFYVVFHYGLVTAMIAHALYDGLIMITIATVRIFQYDDLRSPYY